MEKFERIKTPIPDGYFAVRYGEVLPDDLLYIWPGGGFQRADAPDWTGGAVTDARDAILCIRKPGHNFTGGRSRTYKLKSRAGDANSGVAAGGDAKNGGTADGQISLF